VTAWECILKNIWAHVGTFQQIEKILESLPISVQYRKKQNTEKLINFSKHPVCFGEHVILETLYIKTIYTCIPVANLEL